MADLRGADLMDAQARYVALFDHSRSLSLHLYEHSHGESRDRGQAMVNLLNHYRANGLDPGTSELPDFLPLFLEFLSTRPAGEARALLGQAVEVVALLRARLEQRGAPYAAVFRAIEALAPHRADEAAIRETVGRRGARRYPGSARSRLGGGPGHLRQRPRRRGGLGLFRRIRHGRALRAAAWRRDDRSPEWHAMTYLDQFLFGFYPYLCMVAFFLGSWARFDRSQYTWRSQSSQLLRRKQLFWGSILFHVGILGLFFGHFFGLLTPPEIYHALGLSTKAKQLMAIVVGGILAVDLLHRHDHADPPPPVRRPDPPDQQADRHLHPAVHLLPADPRHRRHPGLARQRRGHLHAGDGRVGAQHPHCSSPARRSCSRACPGSTRSTSRPA